MPGRKVDRKWFDDRLVDKGLSMRGLANRIGMSPSSLMRRLEGKYDFEVAEINAIATLLGVSATEAARRADMALSPDKTKQLRVTGRVNEANEVEQGVPVDYRFAERPTEYPDNGVALFYPIMNWVLYYQPTKKLEPDAVGRFAVIGMSDGTVRCGVLSKSIEKGRWNVEPPPCGSNGPVIRSVTVAWASPIDWIKA